MRPPTNDAVKARAAEHVARAAGKPAAWKDFVAKARAVLLAKAQLDDEDDADPDDDPDDDDEAPSDAMSPDDDDDDDAETGDDDDSPPTDPSDAAASLAALAADPDALQALHDALVALGADCDPDNCPDAAEKAAVADDLAKLERGLVAAALAKAEYTAHGRPPERRLSASQDALIQRLAATPLPPRTAASVHAQSVGKAEDVDPGAGAAVDLSPSEAQSAFAALTPDERAFLLMKASLRRPIPLP